jgi:hypothetical protein
MSRSEQLAVKTTPEGQLTRTPVRDTPRCALDPGGEDG